jgi:hypothetical protein
MSRVPPIPPQIGIVVGFDFVGSLLVNGKKIGVGIVLVSTQWATESGRGKGSQGKGEERLFNVEKLFEVGMRNKLFDVK